jgi:release factor glutamine methyltransferase
MPTKNWPRKTRGKNTIDVLLKRAEIFLKSASDSPALDAEVLLCSVLKKTRAFLYANPELEVPAKTAKIFEKLVLGRKDGQPIAYLLGKKEFFGREFSVNPCVLIPRPETEGLVEMVLESLKRNTTKNPKILDLGTGSGCIAITVAKEITLTPNITAADVSATDLKTAKRNAKKFSAKIRFVKSDLFSKLPGCFNLVIANLPYVKSSNWRKNRKDLGFEPKIALTDGGDNWRLLEKFLQQLPEHLANHGSAFMEIDPPAKNRLKAWAKKYLSNRKITFYRDLATHNRYAVIR